jgi:F0F1-type ATP synthase gamma subunit
VRLCANIFLSPSSASVPNLSSENASRLTAMERAGKKIDDLLENAPHHLPPHTSGRD